MAYLHQYDYIFAICLLFSALDAYNIGANDVANSFATSVSSKSLTMTQAVILAGICEFLGAVLVGAKVAGTIKNGIISLSAFKGNAGIEMLAFTCALACSATWLMIATKNSWPVSTTYSLVSALAGVGVALNGPKAVQWGWNNGKGLGTIFAGMVIAPSIAAGFGATVYLITKYVVLVRKNAIKWGLAVAPVYFFTVTAVLTMSIVYKGSPSLKLDKLPQTTIALAIVLTALVVAVLSTIFWLPFVYAKVVRKDYTIKWYHFFLGPLLWKRPAPEAPADENHQFVPDYRIHKDDDHSAPALPATRTSSNGTETHIESEEKVKDIEAGTPDAPVRRNVPLAEVEKEIPYGWRNPAPLEGWNKLPSNVAKVITQYIPYYLTRGILFDVHAAQLRQGAEGDRINDMHNAATVYDNEVEHMYSFLQVLTACTNSFAHGSNDVANAVGPFAAVYYVWSEGIITPKDTPTPTWILAFGGIWIVIGLATYGYNIMMALGNRLTLHSPSRGFSMELGSSITVLLASQYGIPVSTTMCIAGSTAGVGICSGGFRAVNWRAFGWIILGWVLTVPITGTAAGCLLALFINAPHW